MQRVARFARYWEMVANSGRFRNALGLMLEGAPFSRFMQFSDWLYARTGKTHEISLERLFEHVHGFMTGELGIARESASAALLDDYGASGARGRLSFMPVESNAARRSGRAERRFLRQVRHLQPQTTT